MPPRAAKTLASGITRSAAKIITKQRARTSPKTKIKAATKPSTCTDPDSSPREDPLSPLANLQAWRLKRLATLTGTAASGTKKELLASLRTTCRLDGLLHSHGARATRHVGQTSDGETVLSVDMGIRNLAYCILKTRCISSGTGDQSPGVSTRDVVAHGRQPIRQIFRLATWRRLDVVPATTSGEVVPSDLSDYPSRPPTKARSRKLTTSKTKADMPMDQDTQTSQETSDIQPPSPANTWSPSSLAPHAIRLAHHFLTQLSATVGSDPQSPSAKSSQALSGPTTILIERQRYRSGGGSQVQEWTLRVNTLEAMLWTALSILRPSTGLTHQQPGSDNPNFVSSGPKQSALHSQTDEPIHRTLEMSPARICAFWTHRTASLRPGLGSGSSSASNISNDRNTTNKRNDRNDNAASPVRSDSSVATNAAASQPTEIARLLDPAWTGTEAAFDAMESEAASQSTGLDTRTESGRENQSSAGSADSPQLVKAESRGFAKGEKIRLVRLWFEEGSLVAETADTAATQCSDSNNNVLTLSLHSTNTTGTSDIELENRVKAFMQGGKAPREIREGKLDDLADCVVQGVTFALWEENRGEVRRVLRGADYCE